MNSLNFELIFTNLGVTLDAGEIHQLAQQEINAINFPVTVKVLSVTKTKSWLVVIIQTPVLPLDEKLTRWLVNAVAGAIVIALQFKVRYRQYEIHHRTSSLLLKKEWRKPKIALCVIARDEAPYISEFLKHIRGWVDDIVVVVDSRTVDSTAEVAGKNGARVFFHSWQDDFSKLRNYAIKMSAPECEWILSLDVDERASPELLLRLRELVQNLEHDAYEFQLVNEVTNTVEPKIRLFKRYCYWKGKVHEIPSGYTNLGKTSLKIFHAQRWIKEGGEIAEKRNRFYRELESN